MANQAWFQGEGGGRWLMDLPLGEDLRAQLAKGLLVQVDGPDDDLRDERQAAPEPAVTVTKPARTEDKAAWVDYAHAVTDRSREELDGMTKADLVREFG